MSEDKRRELRDVIDEMERYFEGFQKDLEEAVKKSIYGGGSPTKPFVAGFSFNLGPEGKPFVQVFGNNPVRGDGFRSPISEQVMDEKNGMIRLLLEMPGVEKQDIKVEATEESAVITAEKEDRKYRSEIGFKAPVRPESGKAEYKNGMLEISFSLKDKANKGIRRVNVV
jgi:HSP20 family protein